MIDVVSSNDVVGSGVIVDVSSVVGCVVVSPIVDVSVMV